MTPQDKAAVSSDPSRWQRRAGPAGPPAHGLFTVLNVHPTANSFPIDRGVPAPAVTALNGAGPIVPDPAYPSLLSKMRSPSFPPRRPSALIRYLIPCIIFVCCLYYLNGQGPAGPTWDRIPNQEATATVPAAALATGDHPIDILVRAAEGTFNAKLSRESRTLADAATAYRQRRGRHPPPGFREWYRFAKQKKAIIMEEFWDQIYHDLEPFWALKPARIRKDAWDFEMRISIRNGKATTGSDWFWTTIWVEMIKTIEHLLPDMDLALNAMDEPRLVVPWEQMEEHMAVARRTRTMVEPRDVISGFQRLPRLQDDPSRGEETPEKEWEDTSKLITRLLSPARVLTSIVFAGPYWAIARRGCPDGSPTREEDIMTDFDHSPTIAKSASLVQMEGGYVANFTSSADICHQPDLQGLNGIFVEPLTVSATKVLFPMFGGSKLTVNNEILMPAPMYWNEEDRFFGKSELARPWNEKENMAIWRGVATGGRSRKTNWKAFQRHRFVAMNNGTKLARAEGQTEVPSNFDMPAEEYNLRAHRDGGLGKWVDSWANISFVDLMCKDGDQGPGCDYASSQFSLSDPVKMAEQFACKYLPDIDGNSFSGRYLGFLRSNSLPIKATVWREWHDSRLVAWKHFVPMDNRFGDWFGIMEYFVGSGSEVEGHDAVAERIASAGREWAEKVLRKEDMQIYVLRLLLEYARVSDERREKMGWVEDLME